ncbi:MAG: winged helix-turn-helix domain-containing protein [Candidatus Methanoperedens sp.]|nr:winged helix-turn-helix domain-containing protein [Candidatus Methanoperedens sp.]
MFAGTLGGYTRGYILKNISDKPYYAHQLADDLNLDYETTRRHLDILVKNRIITTKEDKSGKRYYISKNMEPNLNDIIQIWEKIHMDIS